LRLQWRISGSGSRALQAGLMSFTIAHLSDPHLGPLPVFRLPRSDRQARDGLYQLEARARTAQHYMGMLKRLVADMRAKSPIMSR